MAHSSSSKSDNPPHENTDAKLILEINQLKKQLEDELWRKSIKDKVIHFLNLVVAKKIKNPETKLAYCVEEVKKENSKLYNEIKNGKRISKLLTKISLTQPKKELFRDIKDVELISRPLISSQQVKNDGKNSKKLDDTLLGKILNKQKHVLQKVLSTQLDTRSIAALSSSHSAFNAELKGKDYWVDKLIAAGCDKELLNKILQANVIQNFKNLYHVFTKLDYCDRVKINDPWVLFCLSGEPSAVTYAISKEKLTANSISPWGETVLQLTARSGSASAMSQALELKDSKGQSINPLDKAAGQIKVLHYAAWSGSVSAMSKALELEDSKGQSIDPLDKAAGQGKSPLKYPR